MTDKEKLSHLSLYIGVCLGFISNHGLFEEFKREHEYILEGIDKVIYGKEDAN